MNGLVAICMAKPDSVQFPNADTYSIPDEGEDTLPIFNTPEVNGVSPTGFLDGSNRSYSVAQQEGGSSSAPVSGGNPFTSFIDFLGKAADIVTAVANPISSLINSFTGLFGKKT